MITFQLTQACFVKVWKNGNYMAYDQVDLLENLLNFTASGSSYKHFPSWTLVHHLPYNPGKVDKTHQSKEYFYIEGNWLELGHLVNKSALS